MFGLRIESLRLLSLDECVSKVLLVRPKVPLRHSACSLLVLVNSKTMLVVEKFNGTHQTHTHLLIAAVFTITKTEPNGVGITEFAFSYFAFYFLFDEICGAPQTILISFVDEHFFIVELQHNHFIWRFRCRSCYCAPPTDSYHLNCFLLSYLSMRWRRQHSTSTTESEVHSTFFRSFWFRANQLNILHLSTFFSFFWLFNYSEITKEFEMRLMSISVYFCFNFHLKLWISTWKIERKWGRNYIFYNGKENSSSLSHAILYSTKRLQIQLILFQFHEL